LASINGLPGCPLWVKSGHVRCNKPCPLYTQ
jgi:hypothetical protein